jgi:chromate transporter
MRFGDVPSVAAVLYGIKPAVTAIVLFAAYRIASRALRYKPLWLISIAAFVAIFAFDVPFPLIVLTAGVVGYFWGRIAPARFASGGHGVAQQSFGPALIDDGAVLPHTRLRPAKVAAFALLGLAIWAATLGALAGTFGWTGTLTQMGWFFTKAALLTFGGAYAVLPYVYQGAVETYGWLTGPQMIDGLALGETTPGPLIMVVAFVGFVGGWTKAFLGPDALVPAGVAGALVATFFTFLPSFVFILVGAPVVESTHGDIRFTAPLTGITAAIVGVIVNLAVFFAYHVFWPKGLDGPFDLFPALLAVATLVALWRFKVGIIPAIAGCGAAGLVHHFVVKLI